LSIIRVSSSKMLPK